MDPDRLASIDRELDAFGVPAARLEATREAARALRSKLTAEELDGELGALASAEGLARPTTWDEARQRRSDTPSSEGSGTLEVDERVLRDDAMPPVLSLEPAPPEPSVSSPPSESLPPLSASTALYIDPPTSPPPSSAEPALDLDPEAGLVEPGAAPLSYVPPPPKPKTQPPPRPSAVPAASTDEMLAEMLDAPEDASPAEGAPPPLPPRPSVAENETDEALAAISAGSLSSLDSEASAAFDASLADEDEADVERTVMVKAAALLPPAGDEAEGDFVIDIDEDVMVIDEEEDAAASTKSRPPPPPPSKRPSTRPLPGSTPPGRSRPPEPPGKGFLSKLLKSNKP